MAVCCLPVLSFGSSFAFTGHFVSAPVQPLKLFGPILRTNIMSPLSWLILKMPMTHKNHVNLHQKVLKMLFQQTAKLVVWLGEGQTVSAVTLLNLNLCSVLFSNTCAVLKYSLTYYLFFSHIHIFLFLSENTQAPSVFFHCELTALGLLHYEVKCSSRHIQEECVLHPPRWKL